MIPKLPKSKQTWLLYFCTATQNNEGIRCPHFSYFTELHRVMTLATDATFNKTSKKSRPVLK
jgi:hypothetical protein